MDLQEDGVSFLSMETPSLSYHFRLRIRVKNAEDVAVLIAALDGALVFLNGTLLARVGENSDSSCAFARRLELPLRPGRNELHLLAWRLGEHAAYSRNSAFCGIAVRAENPAWSSLLDSGKAPWKAHPGQGIDVRLEHIAATAGYPVSMNWRALNSPRNGWTQAMPRTTSPDVPRIFQSPLPPQQETPWENARILFADTGDDDTQLQAGHSHPVFKSLAASFIAGETTTIPPHAAFRALIDLGEYTCSLLSFTAQGEKASVSLRFAEALFTRPQTRTFNPVKTRRDQWDGLWFFGKGDLFLPGEKPASFTNLDWQAGRFIALEIKTGKAPLTLQDFRICRSGYPLNEEGFFHLDAKDDGSWRRLMVNTVRACAHDTYMDCPHYERLMYLGDTRLQILTTYLLTRDRRLPRKSLILMGEGQLPDGMLRSRYPDRHTQIIPPFSLWWIAMLEDYAIWNDDPMLLRALLPRARRVIDAFLQYMGPEGLCISPPGWNFYDWSSHRGWKKGGPPEHDGRPCALTNWHLAMTLEIMARLENAFGQPQKARSCHRLALRMADCLKTRFFMPDRNLFSDDDEHRHFSQHTQILAILSGLLDRDEARLLYKSMMAAPKTQLAQCTIYFSHYLFSAMHLFGDSKSFLKALEYWRKLPDFGFTTTPERPEPSRSDCHAWGAHPYYSVMTFLAGVTPRGYGATAYDITPCANLPTGFCASVPLPAGLLTVRRLEGRTELTVPEKGTFWLNNRILTPGTHSI